jgi:AcrR family transcriptional regulator
VTQTRTARAPRPGKHVPGKHVPGEHVAGERVRGARTAHTAPTTRSQAERVEAMRARLLDATIDCLTDLGYSAMSTNDIVRRAHVSRGALAHHFPTKADLVQAAAERLIEQRGQQFRERFGAIPPEQRTVAEALRVLWSFYADDGATALIDLTVAARHRPELRVVLASVPDRIAALTNEMLAEFFPELARLPFVEQSMLAIHAMYGGFALNAMTGDARWQGDDVRSLLSVLAALLPQFTTTREKTS